MGVIPTVAAVDVPRALRTFHGRYPDVRVGLISGSSDALVRRVTDGRLDLATTAPPDRAPAGHTAWFDMPARQTAGKTVSGLHEHMVRRKAGADKPSDWPEYEI